MRAVAVIGACFGDEGKGLVTDYFASQRESIVVRSNGGAQAGHTVVCPDGRRHVFHHYGAGTYAGAPTILSKFFIINPLVWEKELLSLASETDLFFDGDAIVTTPFDMLLNQERERERGSRRHGSCGLGIGETVHRNVNGIPITASMLSGRLALKSAVNAIANWIPSQITWEPSQWFLELMQAKEWLVANFLNTCQRFVEVAKQIDPRKYTREAGKQIVFEGAQGLLLDASHKFFPHVTRGRTGLTNVLQLCDEWGIRDLEATYVTRTYMTRHGAGPFPTENSNLSFEDFTNTWNEWQGQPRFGDLDCELVSEAIALDLSACPVAAKLAVTHSDQLSRNHSEIAERLGLPLGYVSSGRTRMNVLESAP